MGKYEVVSQGSLTRYVVMLGGGCLVLRLLRGLGLELERGQVVGSVSAPSLPLACLRVKIAWCG